MRREAPTRRVASRPSLIRGISGVLLVAAAMNFLFVLLDYESEGSYQGFELSELVATSVPGGRSRVADSLQGTDAGMSKSYVLSMGSNGTKASSARGMKKAKKSLIKGSKPKSNGLSMGSDGTKAPSARGMKKAKKSLNKGSKPKATIAYAVSATSCSKDTDVLLQGAAVLGHSIHLSSIENPRSGSKYAYKLYAFVHPSATDCSHIFERLGYHVQIRDTPINVSDIRNDWYRENVKGVSCCGEKEFIKLYSYVLTDHPAVVHLDMDSIVLRPFDDLFDAMIDGPNATAATRIPVMFDAPLPDQIDAFFTRDYNMVNLGHKHPGIQGGFLVVRPNPAYFEEYRQIILEGDFRPGSGWVGKYGGYYGARQIQGICSYFFDARHPNTAVELNRCVYNQMADNPRRERRKSKENVCLDGREECEDCRISKVSKIVSAHFTAPCGKPWQCTSLRKSEENGPLCRDLRREWFAIRKNLEESNRLVGHVPTNATGTFEPETYFGYCNLHRYIPLKMQ